jgi:hypothetical protein
MIDKALLQMSCAAKFLTNGIKMSAKVKEGSSSELLKDNRLNLKPDFERCQDMEDASQYFFVNTFGNKSRTSAVIFDSDFGCLANKVLSASATGPPSSWSSTATKKKTSWKFAVNPLLIIITLR